jgi:hypothetical protein
LSKKVTMANPNPHDPERRRRREQEGQEARAYMQGLIDRTEARWAAERERRERRRARLRRLTFGLLGR